MHLLVYRAGTQVGTLDMASNEPFYGFIYDPEYLKSDPKPLSLSLPLRPERFDGWATLPYFDGLLPEGDIRASVARQLRIPEGSPARLLRALGKDCAGDIAILEEDDPYIPPAEALYEPLPEGLCGIARNPRAAIAQMRADNRLSLAGGQEKIALYHDKRASIQEGWHLPLGGSPSTHIIKPQMLDDYPCLVENEFLCMRLARAAGLRVADVSLVSCGRSMLVIGRYDRRPTSRANSAGLTIFERVHQEDFCQALGVPSLEKYEQEGGPGFAKVSDLLLHHSARYLGDRAQLVRIAVFNYLIGNCDAHAKNFSMLFCGGPSVVLAPAYDLVSTTVYGQGYGMGLSRAMGMRIGGHYHIDRIDSGDFRQLAHDLGMSWRAFWRLASAMDELVCGCFDDVVEELSAETEQDVETLVQRIWDGICKRRKILADGTIASG